MNMIRVFLHYVLRGLGRRVHVFVSALYHEVYADNTRHTHRAHISSFVCKVSIVIVEHDKEEIRYVGLE